MKSPTTIGRYRLLRRVGAGGMGVVYEAEDEREQRRVAVKVLLPHAADEADGLLRFKREFRALARLRHPNVVRVFDAGIDDETPYIAMEFVSGKDARTYLRGFPEGPARDRETVQVVRQLFAALSHVHARRIVHRDLKPENIIVTPEGRVKLMDFGVARVVRAPTSSSGLLGTFAYMSPEQVTTGDADARSDLYAVGVLLYELLSGRYPFPVEPPAAALHHHVNTPPELVRHVNPRADPALSELTHKLLEKDPLDRPQSADAAARLLSQGESASGTSDGTREVQGQLFVPRFVARAADVEMLEGVASDAAAGRGRLVLVEGSSGVGKSRLVEEIRQRLRRRAHVLVGSCAAEGMQPYGGFLPILDAIAGIAQRAPDEARDRIVGRDVGLVGVVSPRLAALGGPVSAAQLDPTERKIRLHKAMVGVIGRLALTKPVILVLDDLHWADPLTLELAWDAARTLLAPRPNGVGHETVCPVALIITRRPGVDGASEAAATLIGRLEHRLQFTRIALGALDRGDVAEMLRTMTGVARPRPEVVEALFDASEGLPLMVQEVVQAWVVDGLLVRSTLGAWRYRGRPLDLAERAERDEDLPVARPRASSMEPPSSRIAARIEPSVPSQAPRFGSIAPPPRAGPPPERTRVVRAKYSKLSAIARELAERLALLGRVFSSALVRAMGPADEDQLLDAIDELVSHDVIVEELFEDGVRYRFYHEDFPEVVVGALERERKTELHRTVARAIERAFVFERRRLAYVLSRHFRHGDRAGRALRYVLWVAEAALQRGDLSTALRRLDDGRAIARAGGDDRRWASRRASVEMLRADALLDFGRARESMEAAELRLAEGTTRPDAVRAALLVRRAAAQAALGRIDEALVSLGRIRRPGTTRAVTARALELEGRIRVTRGEFARARQVLELAIDRARESGLDDLAEDLSGTVGMVLHHQGEHQAALVRLEEALQRARLRERTKRIAELVGYIGLVHAARNVTTGAIACFREALELAEARGVRGDRERWAGAMGIVLARLHQFEDAEEKLREALDLAVEAGNREGEATWRTELGIHHLEAHRYDPAYDELVRGLGIARDIGFLRGEAWAEIHLGAVLLERSYDRIDEARERIEDGLERAREGGNDDVRIVGLLFLSRVHRAEGETGRARDALDRAEVLARASQNLFLRERVDQEREGP